MQMEHRLSALLQLHLHSPLNTWVQYIAQRQLQAKMRNIWVLAFGASYIRDFAVNKIPHYWRCVVGIHQWPVDCSPYEEFVMRKAFPCHNVVMRQMDCNISRHTAKQSLLHDDVMKWKHFPRYWPLWRESTGHRWIQGQWRRALTFSLVCVWTNGWANNRYADYLRRHCAHYDVTVMSPPRPEQNGSCFADHIGSIDSRTVWNR